MKQYGPELAPEQKFILLVRTSNHPILMKNGRSQSQPSPMKEKQFKDHSTQQSPALFRMQKFRPPTGVLISCRSPTPFHSS